MSKLLLVICIFNSIHFCCSNFKSSYLRVEIACSKTYMQPNIIMLLCTFTIHSTLNNSGIDFIVKFILEYCIANTWWSFFSLHFMNVVLYFLRTVNCRIRILSRNPLIQVKPKRMPNKCTFRNVYISVKFVPCYLW